MTSEHKNIYHGLNMMTNSLYLVNSIFMLEGRFVGV